MFVIVIEVVHTEYAGTFVIYLCSELYTLSFNKWFISYHEETEIYIYIYFAQPPCCLLFNVLQTKILEQMFNFFKMLLQTKILH
jgi:hypothetical protein